MNGLINRPIVFIPAIMLFLVSLFSLSCQQDQEKKELPRQLPNMGIVTHENDKYMAWLILARVHVIDQKNIFPAHSYLVEGNDAALLIDTGYGKGDLSGFVKSVTQLPVTVVNTHGHQDHSGGNSQFEKVYIHPADIARLKYKDNAVPIENGHVFDLGGRKLEVIEIPGHTPGHIALLDSEAKIIFAGDEVTITGTWMQFPYSTPLETYLESMKNLKKRAGEFDCCFGGHGQTPVDTRLLTEIIQNTQNILDGKVPEEPNEGAGGEALVSRYDRSKILYKKENLRKE